MTAQKQTEVERLGALVDRKLKTMESAKRAPSLSELNAARRLIDWLNRERRLEQVKKLTTR